MAEHSEIADGERHEPKGASTATNNHVLKSNGDGSTSFGQVGYSELTGTPLAAQVLDVGASPTNTALGNKINELLAALRTAGLLEQ